MQDVRNLITKGIGASPGSIRYFVLFGLDVNPGQVSVGPVIRGAQVGLPVLRAAEINLPNVRGAEIGLPVIRGGEEI